MVVLPWVTEGWRGTRRLIGTIVCATAADSTDGKIAGYKQKGSKGERGTQVATEGVIEQG